MMHDFMIIGVRDCCMGGIWFSDLGLGMALSYRHVIAAAAGVRGRETLMTFVANESMNLMKSLQVELPE